MTEKSKEYRQKAAEAADRAGRTKDNFARQMYEDIARRWQEMADMAEQNKW